MRHWEVLVSVPDRGNRIPNTEGRKGCSALKQISYSEFCIRYSVFALLIALCSLLSLPAHAAPPEREPGSVLYRLKTSASSTAVNELNRHLGLHGSRHDNFLKDIRVQKDKLDTKGKTEEEVCQELMATGALEYCEPDYIAHIMSTIPNDPYYRYQWHLPQISAPQAWDVAKGTGVIIAIIDSGADPTQPDLVGKLVPGYNFLLSNTDTHDTGCNSGHGTAVAGAAAAMTDNSIGVAGVAWSAQIMPLVVAPSMCTILYSLAANAIDYAADHGARIMNASFAGAGESSTMEIAISYAWSKRSVLFAAAGNCGLAETNGGSCSETTAGSNTVMYPAGEQYAVAVDATRQSPTDTLATFSNWGSYANLVSAPGDIIETTVSGGSYGEWWGTSFATPIAAGVGALILSANPSLTPAGLVSVLTSNTDPLGSCTGCSLGHGRVNAYKAVCAALPGGCTTTFSPCDVNHDGVTNVTDVQTDVNAALGITACSSTYDINKDNVCNIIDVQRVVNAALGGACVSL